MKSLLSNFVGLYPLSKTLRFELKPVGEFNYEEFLLSKTFNSDEARHEAYPEAKEIIDDYHKQFIEEALSGLELDWNPLYEAVVRRRKSDKNDEVSKKELEKVQSKMRKEIVEQFKRHENWGKLFTEKLFSAILTKNLVGDYEKMRILEKFDKFSVYFKGFHKNRENVYSDKEQSTAISYRIVHDNFVKFIDNITVYELLKEHCNNELKTIEDELHDVLNGLTLGGMFTVDYFNQCFTQKGIDKYNAVIGGATADGGIKIKGVNEVGNLYLQRNPTSTLKRKQLKMQVLFKQILSDRETYSFIPEKFESEQSVKDGVKGYYDVITAKRENEEYSCLNGIEELVSDIEKCDLSKIYVCGGAITKFSKLIFGKWDVLVLKLKDLDIEATAKPKRKSSKKSEESESIEKWLEKKNFSLKDIIDVANNMLIDEGEVKIDVLAKFREKVFKCIEQVREGYMVKMGSLAEEEISGNKEAVEVLKSYLDDCNELLHTIKLLHLGKMDSELDKDVDFYSSDFYEWYGKIALITPLYNKVRNYMTRKPADEGKMSMKFGNPTLADGWDKNKEKDNNVVILLKDGNYYLGIMSKEVKGANISFKTIPIAKDGESTYKKMCYSLIPNPTRDIPNLMVIDGKTQSKTPRKDKETGVNVMLEKLKNEYLPININNIRKKESFKKSSPNFNKIDADMYIDYYKQRLIEYNESKFVFELKKSSDYDDYTDFIEDVRKQSYKMTFEDVPVSYVDKLVEEKKLFLFQIYNKDFSENSKGTPNLHTLYWKALFSEDNLMDVVFKLNGEAELFYRKQVIKTPVVHKVGSMLVNKRYNDGTVIPQDVYRRLYEYFNGKREKNGLEEYISRAVFKKAKFDITKDKRYVDEYKFLFHVPIKINFKADRFKFDPKKRNKYEYIEFNDNVNEKLRGSGDDIKIIGLDRGERHLIYLTMIDGDGNILKQHSFNSVESDRWDGTTTSFDYHEKLDQVEGDRDKARKDWGRIENIKELKEGYLSQVVHQISKLMVEENAIVVMEDLNFGFKRGRFKVEKQVYQKFEKALIDKLSYLVFKNKEDGEGSVLRGLQLTSPFESFNAIGKQMGWLYYVPAGYTSKICPRTGFVNVFNFNDVTNSENRRKFFDEMDKIVYNAKDDVFEFSFDYSNKEYKTYQTLGRNKWTVCTNGKRIKSVKKDGKWTPEDVDLSDSMRERLKDKVEYKDGDDIKEAIMSLDDKDIKELFDIFKLSLQMRNSKPNSDVDYIISPVRDKNGEFFDSRNAKDTEPKDADANGAYHIALKGLMVLNKIRGGEKKNLQIKNEEWFKERQK